MADKPSKPLAAGSSAIDPSPAGYVDWLTKLKVDIRQAQSRALFSVNAEMIQLYSGSALYYSAPGATGMGRKRNTETLG